MASRYSIEAIYRLIDQYSNPLKKMSKSTKMFTRGLRSDFASAQRTVKRWGQNIKRYAWVGITAIAAGVGYLAKQGVELASDLFEVQNVVDTTFKSSKETINEWSKAAIDAFGLSELQAKQFTGTLGAAMKSSGVAGDQLTKMSTDLVGLSGDFASFYNLPHEEAFNKIKSGMMGQSKPLRDLGINMSVANLEAFALSQGIEKQFRNMSESEKMILRYNYLMSVSKDAQGDFAKTLNDSLANQQRVLATKFNQKIANAMTKIIPLLIKITDGFSKWLDTLDTEKIGNFAVSIFKAGQTVAEVFISILKFLKPIKPLLGGIVAAFLTYKTGMLAAALATAIFNGVVVANPVGLVIVSIGILIGLIVVLVQNWKIASKWIGIITVAFALLGMVMIGNPIFLIIAAIGVLIQVGIIVVNNWKSIVKWLSKAWDWIVKLAKAIWDGIVKAFKAAVEWISKTGQKFTFILGPLGWVTSALIEIGKQWDNITEKFKAGDILGGILAIGGAILSGLMAPIQGFLELVSKIPGVGELAKGGVEKIQELRMGLTGETISTDRRREDYSPVTPEERSSLIREEQKTSGELVIRDETGKAKLGKRKGKPGYKIRLQTSGGFVQ